MLAVAAAFRGLPDKDLKRSPQNSVLFGREKKETPRPDALTEQDLLILPTKVKAAKAEAAVTDDDKDEQKSPGFISRALSTVRGFFFMTLALIGGGHVYDSVIGDGPMPKLNVIKRTAPSVAAKIYENNTASLAFREATPEQYWQALQPTLEILDAVAPEIGNWVRDRHQAGKILYAMPGNAPDDAIAGYQPMTRQLFLSNTFWRFSNGEKASTLAHEFRHSQQNIPKSIAVRMTQLITGDLLKYPSRIEDEAYMYQLEFYRAVGMNPSDIRFYLDDRDLYHIRD